MQPGSAGTQRRRGPFLLFRNQLTFIGWPMRFAAGVFRLLVARPLMSPLRQKFLWRDRTAQRWIVSPTPEDVSPEKYARGANLSRSPSGFIQAQFAIATNSA